MWWKKIAFYKIIKQAIGNETFIEFIELRFIRFYVSLGIKVKVHRILKFKQSDRLKKYISFNTDKRIQKKCC